MLKELVKERLMTSADEIFALFESTIATYEEELSRTKEENERHRQQLQAVCKTLQIKDVYQLIGRQENCPAHLQGRNSSLNQEDPHPPNIKREDEVLWIIQEGVCLLGSKKADPTDLPLTLVSVMIEDHEDKSLESSQFHHGPSEENGGEKPPSSSSPQHMTTEADGDPSGGSQADNFLAPLSDSKVDDMDAARDPLSRDAGTRTHIQHSECSQNKTGKLSFPCSACAKSFSFKSSLTRHMIQHTGVKPFACSICGNRFSYKEVMLSHMRTHTGEKPFCCPVCGKRFSQRSPMVSHMKTHSGKLYPCSVCSRSYYYKASLKAHTQSHDRELK
nr:zinc finger protein 892-like [Nerophis lumbriciformis]